MKTSPLGPKSHNYRFAVHRKHRFLTRRLTLLFAVLVLMSIVPVQAFAATSFSEGSDPAEAPEAPILDPEDIEDPVLDGDFNTGLRKQTWADTEAHKVPFGRTSAVALPIPPGAHDSVEVDLEITQGTGYAHGSYGIRLWATVTPHGAPTPSYYDFFEVFNNYQANSHLTANDMRLTWDLRVPRGDVMDLHLYCETIAKAAADACAVSDIRGFADTGDWTPSGWNGPKSHAFGIYENSMPLVVIDGPPMASYGPDNPFLGMERSGGVKVALRSPLVTLPKFSEPTQFTASARLRRTINNTSTTPACVVDISFVPYNQSLRERTLVKLSEGLSSDWQTVDSTPGPLPKEYSGQVGYIEVEGTYCSAGVKSAQAIGIDSLSFYLNGEFVQLPLLQCDGRIPTIVGTDQTETILGTVGRDVIFGGAGNDIIYGSPNGIESTQPDVICGGAGYDKITGSLGNDRIFGEGERDMIQGGPGNDFLSGGAGDDEIDGYDGDDHLQGGDGDDQLMGSGGVDYCDGGAGTNQITLCEDRTLPFLIDAGDLEGFRAWAAERGFAGDQRRGCSSRRGAAGCPRRDGSGHHQCFRPGDWSAARCDERDPVAPRHGVLRRGLGLHEHPHERRGRAQRFLRLRQPRPGLVRRHAQSGDQGPAYA